MINVAISQLFYKTDIPLFRYPHIIVNPTITCHSKYFRNFRQIILNFLKVQKNDFQRKSRDQF